MIKLYVNYTELEIGQDTQNILATFSINDVAGVAERRGSITQEMFLPATPVNSQTLASCPASGYVASIESNGIVCFTGKLRVSKTEYLRGDVVGYSCTMYGDNLDFVYLLNKKQLRDIEKMFTESFYHDITTVTDGVSGVVSFPIVNYGKWDAATLDILELRPAISAKWLINQIFKEIGYTVVSDFLNSTEFADVHTLYTCGAYNCAESWKRSCEFRAALSARQSGTYTSGGFLFDLAQFQPDDDSTPPNFDPSLIYDTSSFTFYPVSTMNYRVTVFLECTDTVRPVLFLVRNSGAGSWVLNFPNLISDDGTYMKWESDILEFSGGGTEYGIGFGGTGSYSYEAGSWILFERMPEVQTGDLVNIADCLPKETTQLSYIKGIIHAFNLYVYADVALRKIYFEPRNAWVSPDLSTVGGGFFPNTEIISLNDSVDFGENVTISTFDNLNESVRFTYKDGDNYVKQIESGSNSELYAAVWNMQTESIQKQTVSENPVFGRFSLLKDNTFANSATDPHGATYIPTIIVPRLWSEDWIEGEDYPAKSYDFPPMLALIRYVTCPEYEISATPKTEYPYAFMFDFPNLAERYFSLSYGNEIDFNGNTVAGLFQRFYLREQVSKRGGDVLKLRAVVSAWLINYLNNIKYMTFIEYSGNIYSIQEIRNFVIGEDSICEITLLLERFASQSDVNDIESNNPNCLNNV